jgi:cytochrome P450
VKQVVSSKVERVGFDPKDPSVREDPYTHYDELRTRCPVVYSTEVNEYFVTDYAAIHAILMDDKTFSNEGATNNPFGDVRVLVTADDPAHRRHRKLIARAFTPKRVADMEPYAERIANELVDAFVDQGACDLIESFAYRLPVAMIAGMLGVPEQDHARFRKWADDLFAVTASPTAEVIAYAMASLAEFGQYILGQAEAGTADNESLLGKENVLAALRRPDNDGETLSDQEFVIATLQLLAAGHETTTNLIANGVWQLSNHPEQYQRLLNDQSLIEAAVEEILRFDTPVLHQWRRTTTDTEIAGLSVPVDSIIAVVLGAANRDPARWEAPDKFDVTRPISEARQHFSFGTGIHTCLGAALARLEAKVALRTLLDRLPGLQIDDSQESIRATPQFLHGWKTLRIRWST